MEDWGDRFSFIRTATLSRLAGAGHHDARTEAPQYPIERLTACSRGQRTLGKPGQHSNGGVTSPAWAVLARSPGRLRPSMACRLMQTRAAWPVKPVTCGRTLAWRGGMMGCSQLPTTTSRRGRVAVVRRRPIRTCRRMVH